MTDRTNRPGPLEGEPAWVAHFWDLACSGEGESSYPNDSGSDETADLIGPEVTHFRVDGDEETRFGLPTGTDVWVWSDSQGFVIAKTSREAVAEYFGIEPGEVVP